MEFINHPNNRYTQDEEQQSWDGSTETTKVEQVWTLLIENSTVQSEISEDNTNKYIIFCWFCCVAVKQSRKVELITP